MPVETYAWPLKRVLETLEKNKVRYILLGGQAVVAYGAAQFTRDADFWIQPTQANVRRLRNAMRELGASSRFLPPLELKWLAKGHGVHFSFTVQGRRYHLDFLGKPPRVLGFMQARHDATTVPWHGLEIKVLDIPRLVQTKKTDRDKDYLAIQTLVDGVLAETMRKKRPSTRVVTWLMHESRSPSQLKFMVAKWKSARRVAGLSTRKAANLAFRNAPASAIEMALRQEEEGLKQENRAYWKPFLVELRALHRMKR